MSSQAQSNGFTIEEYFALERASERRFEYRDGEVVCMSGRTREHAAIARNIVQRLARLRAGCQAFGSDLAVYVPGGLPYRWPWVQIIGPISAIGFISVFFIVKVSGRVALRLSRSKGLDRPA